MNKLSNPIHGIGALACAKLIAQGVSWTSTVLVMRELDPNAYGIVAISAIYVGFAAILSEFGMSQSLLRAERPKPLQAQQLLGLSIAISCLIFCVLILSTSLYTYLTRDINYLAIVTIQSMAVIINSVSLHSTSELQRDGRHATIGAVEILCVITAAVSSFVFAKNGYGLYSIILGPLFGAILKIITQAQLANTSLSPRIPSRELFFEKYMFAKKTVPTSLLYQAENNIDLIIGSQRLSPFDTGVYSTANYWANMPFGRIMNVLNQVLLPYYISLNSTSNRSGIDRSRADQVTAMAYFSCAIFWGTACCASEIVGILLGDKWRNMAPILTILLIPLPVRFIAENLYLMSLSSKTIIDLRAIQTGNLFLIAILAFSTSSLGVMTFAITIGVGLFITSSIKIVSCIKHLELPWKLLSTNTISCVLFCFIISLLAYNLRPFLELRGINSDLESLFVKATFLGLTHVFFAIILIRSFRKRS